MGKVPNPQPTAHIPQPWFIALSEAWDACCAGSYAIGAVVVNEAGEVIARGRNRLGEPRGVEGGVIRGHDLAHAEINALLDVQEVIRPDCCGWTVLTTVQPCPQCAGAIAMSGLRAVEYAAPDPWAGCTRLLTDDPYVSQKNIRVGRAPEEVQRLALRLALVSFMADEHDPQGRFFATFHDYQSDVDFALQLHQSGVLAGLRETRATLEQALAVLA